MSKPNLLIPLLLILLQGCDATLNTQPNVDKSNETSASRTTTSEPAQKEEVKYRNFSTDSLYSLLVAELALLRQEYEVALPLYIEEATNSRDLQLITRAARIAQYLRANTDTITLVNLWLMQEPGNIEAITMLANATLELGDPLKALTYAEQLLRLENNLEGDNSGGPSEGQVQGADNFIETIANYSKQSSDDTQAQLLERITDLSIQHPQSAPIHVALSILYQASNNLDQALNSVSKALALNAQYTSAIIQEILLLQLSDQNEVATDKLRLQIENNPTNSRLRLLYARLLTDVDVNQAYEQYSELSNQSPQQLDLKFSKALLASELGKWEEAETLFLELKAQDYQQSTGAVDFYLGYINEEQSNFDIAIKHYSDVVRGDNYLPANQRIIGILFAKQSYAQVRQNFKRLREELPDKQEQLYLTESSLLLEAGLDQQAMSLLNKGITSYPDNTSLRYNRSILLEEQGKLDLAEADLQHALVIEPNNPSLLNGLGYLLANKTNRYEEAFNLIEKALALRPESAAIIDSMGWVLFKQGKLKQAIKQLQLAYQKMPDSEVAAHLGEALWENGQKDQARKVWKEHLKENPDAPHIIETLQRLGVSLDK